jgi:putative ABC transport system permease protein
MLKNYIKVIVRNFVKQKAYAIINIVGFSGGLATCILILLYVIHELSYDKFHSTADRIYRIGVEGNLSGQNVKYPLSNLGTGPAMQKDFYEVESFTRLYPLPKIPIKYGENHFFEERIAYVDPHFFEVFSYTLIQGNPNKALEAPYSIILTRDMAEKYFGDDNPLGKKLKLNNRYDYSVTGIMENFPENSHIKLDFLCSIETYYVINDRDVQEWTNFNNYTYLLLRDNVSAGAFVSKFPAFIDNYLPNLKKLLGGELNYFIQPVTDIHLYSNLGYEMPGNSDIAYVYIFSAVALFILLIACINFMNLATARSAGRAKEVGLRKVMGAEKHMLVKQFLVESMLTCIVSLTVAVVLIRLALPFFNSISGMKLKIPFGEVPWLIPAFIGFALITGLLAGSYPAFFLSAFEPVNVMRGTLKSGTAGNRFRSVLVIVQFVISIALLSGTGIMLNQLRFMKNKNLGFNKENVIVIPIMDQSIRERIRDIKSEIRSNSDVIDVCSASDLPGEYPDYSAFVPEGYTLEQTQLMHRINGDPDLVTTLGMKIIAGRNFSIEFSTDPEDAIIINETAAKKYGWDNPIGKKIGFFTDDKMAEVRYRNVVGVVQDFHVRSLHDKILPLLLTNESDYLEEIAVRINTSNVSDVLNFLKEKWTKFDPNRPFDYYFLDSHFNQQYQSEENLQKIIGYFTLFAIFIACLGLYGMASFMAEQRFKEIGIRKTLGASVSNILVLISKDVVKLIIIANILALPIAYYVFHRWLESFAYRTKISALTFLVSAALVFFIGYSTIAYQSIKAALLNPVDAIRTE